MGKQQCQKSASNPPDEPDSTRIDSGLNLKRFQHDAAPGSEKASVYTTKM
jgi:hypothetical protein